MLLVVAGNYSQAQIHMRMRGLEPHEWRYLEKPHEAAGWAHADYTAVGTYWENPEYFAILEQLKQRDCKNV